MKGMELTGRHIVLEPLRSDHAGPLAQAAAEARESYAWAPVPRTMQEAEAFVASRLALRDAGTWFSYATRRLSDDTVVGSTSFLNIERWDWPASTGNPDSVEIGSTWLAASAQRSVVNTEAKFLMLEQAFDTWAVQRVQIKTDARNTRSRAAIERLGATLEGVLRNYQAAQGDTGTGGVRDTAMYSITRPEWSTIKAELLLKLNF